MDMKDLAKSFKESKNATKNTILYERHRRNFDDLELLIRCGKFYNNCLKWKITHRYSYVI